ATHINATAIAPALPAQHRSARYFTIACSVAKIDQQAFDAFWIALTDAEFDLLARIFVVGQNWFAGREAPTAIAVRDNPAALVFECRLTLGWNASSAAGHIADFDLRSQPITTLSPSPRLWF